MERQLLQDGLGLPRQALHLLVKARPLLQPGLLLHLARRRSRGLHVGQTLLGLLRLTRSERAAEQGARQDRSPRDKSTSSNCSATVGPKPLFSA